jgi:hypothetical protein
MGVLEGVAFTHLHIETLKKDDQTIDLTQRANSTSERNARCNGMYRRDPFSVIRILLSELFLLSGDRYTDVLSTELHAQADVARRLNFQTDWIWA